VISAPGTGMDYLFAEKTRSVVPLGATLLVTAM